MPSVTLNTSLTSRLLTTLKGAASKGSSNAASALLGKSSNVSLTSTLRLGAKTYGNVISGMNSLASVINLSRNTLEKLGGLVDKMMVLAKRAMKPSTGAQTRGHLDREFRELIDKFDKIRDSADLGDKSYLTKDGLSELFKLVGLDSESSQTLSEVFDMFVTAPDDSTTSLASDNTKSKRPMRIPASAYSGVSHAVITTLQDVQTFNVGTGTFGAISSFAVNSASSVQGTNAADFNGDGINDIVTSNNDGTYSISIGNGDGTFKAGVSYNNVAGLNSTSQIDVGDYNNDGNTDIFFGTSQAVTREGALILGNGDGTFSSTPVHRVTENTTSMYGADINADGNRDFIAVGQGGTNTATVYLGNGTGSFTVSGTYNTGTTPMAAVVGDVTGDGVVDLLTVDYDSQQISIFTGTGAGTFNASPTTFGTTSKGNDISLGDFNGDGKNDIAVATDSGVNLLINNGTGTFASAVSYDFGTEYLDINTLDINNDGNLDIVANYFGGQATMLGNGDGTLAAKTVLSGSIADRQSTMVDLNNDDVPDILYRNSTSNYVGIRLAAMTTDTTSTPYNIGPGYFEDPTSARTGSILGVGAADLNGDGIVDLVSGNGSAVSIQLGNGDGTFASATNKSSSIGTVRDVAIADVNNDGRRDIISTSSTSTEVFLGNGNGTFATGVSYSLGGGTGGTDVRVLDVSGDGNADIISYVSGSMRVLVNNGNGTFKAATGTSAYAPSGFDLADVNEDNKLDIITADSSGSAISVMTGNGDGTFQTAVSHSASGNPADIVSRDFNGDGFADVAFATGGNTISVKMGNGNGTFKTAVSYSLGGMSASYQIEASDLDGDGIYDLAVFGTNADASGGQLSILKGSAGGTFSTLVTYSADTNDTTRSATIADVDGDGAPDLIQGGAQSLEVFQGYPLTEGTPFARSVPDFASIFDDERNIRGRPEAYLMFQDLKALRTQIDKNLKGIDRAVDVLGKNIQLVRATGLALLELSDQIKGDENAEQIASKLSLMIRSSAGNALSQAANLEPITVAALTLDLENLNSADD